MEQIITIFLLYQTILATFIGYHYYDNIVQQTQFKKNYNKFIKFIFTTSVGISFTTYILDYINDKAPRELRQYITDIINDIKRYEVTTIESTIQNDIVQLKAEIAKLKRNA